MPEPINLDSQSIAGALREGLNSPDDNSQGGSPANDPADKGGQGGEPNQENGTSGDDPNKPGTDPQKQEENKGTDPTDPNKTPTDPGKPPVNNGEYTKERFDGLMAAWQADKTALQKMQADIEAIKASKQDPAKADPQNPGEIELPDELKDADPEAQEGYRTVMKGVMGALKKAEQAITGKVLDTINQPLREQNELKSKVDAEISTLKVEIGPEFEQNLKPVLQFAIDNDYPAGSLKQAFKAWKNEQQLNGKIKDLTKGKQEIDAINQEEAKKAIIPTGGKTKMGEIPQFDPKVDGDKDIAEILREAMKK